MAFTQNFNSNTSGPVHWELMGPIADRPATADLHTTYLSTDEGDGVLKAYLYTESGWMQMQGIEGFTGGGGSGGGGGGLVVTMIEGDEDVVLNKTWQEIYDAFSGGTPVVVVTPEGVGEPYAYAMLLVCYDGADYRVEISGGTSFAASNASDYPALPK